MPPYWDNKALPTPTLTLPDTLFSTFLIISFIFIENKCLSDAIWYLKREKKVRQKVASNSVDCSKYMSLTIYTTEQLSIFSVD